MKYYMKSVVGLKEVAKDLRHDALLTENVNRALENMTRAAKLEYLAAKLSKPISFVRLAELVDAIGEDIGPTLQTIVEDAWDWAEEHEYSLGIYAEGYMPASEFAAALRNAKPR